MGAFTITHPIHLTLKAITAGPVFAIATPDKPAVQPYRFQTSDL
jgi:hypothetical protein